MGHLTSQDRTAGSRAAVRLHASCVIVGESAVLVRGVAGAGKTGLCLALIEAARGAGLFARMVADDRVTVEPCHGRLLARTINATAGLVERRGLGLTPVPHEDAACVRLVIDCADDEPPRLPEPADLTTEIAGITLPRLAVGRTPGQAGLVLTALALFSDAPWQP